MKATGTLRSLAPNFGDLGEDFRKRGQFYPELPNPGESENEMQNVLKIRFSLGWEKFLRRRIVLCDRISLRFSKITMMKNYTKPQILQCPHFRICCKQRCTVDVIILNSIDH